MRGRGEGPVYIYIFISTLPLYMFAVVSRCVGSNTTGSQRFSAPGAAQCHKNSRDRNPIPSWLMLPVFMEIVLIPKP